MPQVCTLTGTLKDTGQTVLNGKLVIRLDAPIINEDSNPDDLLLTEPIEKLITNGVVNVQLLESETQRVTYHFQFFKSKAGGSYEEKPMRDIDFHAIVPDAASYPFSKLKPTGITTDNLSTGAIRVAKEMLGNPILANQIGEATKIYRGANKPVTTVDNVLWIKDKEQTFWFYNATDGRWQSPRLVVSRSVEDVEAQGTVLVPLELITDYTQIYLIGVRFRAVVASPNGAGNNWKFKAGYQEAASSSLTDTTIEYNTADKSPSVLKDVYVTKNELLDLTTIHRFGFNYAPIGSPGKLDLQVSFEYVFVYP